MRSKMPHVVFTWIRRGPADVAAGGLSIARRSHSSHGTPPRRLAPRAIVAGEASVHRMTR